MDAYATHIIKTGAPSQLVAVGTRGDTTAARVHYQIRAFDTSFGAAFQARGLRQTSCNKNMVSYYC